MSSSRCRDDAVRVEGAVRAGDAMKAASCMRCGGALTSYHALADCVTALRDQRAALLTVALAAIHLLRRIDYAWASDEAAYLPGMRAGEISEFLLSSCPTLARLDEAGKT